MLSGNFTFLESLEEGKTTEGQKSELVSCILSLFEGRNERALIYWLAQRHQLEGEDFRPLMLCLKNP